jgi:putative aldouronate transport system permease protein
MDGQVVTKQASASKVAGSDSSLITRGDKIFEYCLGTIFILISFIVIAPVLNVISVSFSSKEAILKGLVRIFPVDFSTEAYKKVFQDSSFIFSFGYSIALTAGHTLFAMVITTLCAYPLSRSKLKGRNIIMGFIVFTMYFSPGIIPHYLNIKNLGLMNTIWALFIPGALSAYNMIILRTFFQSIDNSLYEAAYLDGCSEFKTLIKIVLPLTTPALATLALFYAVGRWNGVEDVLFYINKPELFTVQLKLKQMMDNINIPNEATNVSVQNLTPENIKAASIVISMVPMLIAYPFVQKYFTKGIMLGSVKG